VGGLNRVVDMPGRILQLLHRLLGQKADGSRNANEPASSWCRTGVVTLVEQIQGERFNSRVMVDAKDDG